MLWPSLYALFVEGLLPEGIRIVGVCRSELDEEGLRRLVADSA